MSTFSMGYWKWFLHNRISDTKCASACCLCSTAARLYPTRQASGPQPQSSSGGAFSGGGAAGGGGFSGRPGFLRRSNNPKTTKTSSTSTNAGVANYQQQSANFANYQNCTIVRSHTPHGNYGYVKVAPKILIFPIFVQVLTVCTSMGLFFNVLDTRGRIEMRDSIFIPVEKYFLYFFFLCWNDCWCGVTLLFLYNKNMILISAYLLTFIYSRRRTEGKYSNLLQLLCLI